MRLSPRSQAALGLSALLSTVAASPLPASAKQRVLGSGDDRKVTPDTRRGAAESLATLGSTGILSLSDAEGRDLALMAKARGLTEEEARKRRQWSDELGLVAQYVAEQRPEVFVGSVLDKVTGEPALYIKGEVDDLIAARVAKASGPITIVDKQPYSFDELEKRRIEAHLAVTSAGYQDVVTSASFLDGGRITVLVQEQLGKPLGSVAVLELLPKEVRTDTQVIFLGDIGNKDRQAFGGMRVWNSGTNSCTSGWSVVDEEGTRGVTTAGHCVVNEINHPGHGIHGLTHQQEHQGQWGDIEWKTSAEDEPAIFYATATETREVNAVEARANISVNEAICTYGRASNNRDCSLTVMNVSISCTIDGVSNDRLVQMNGPGNLTFGDSGSPYSWGTRAYGSHKGKCVGLSVFSVADLYDEALGISVRTK